MPVGRGAACRCLPALVPASGAVLAQDLAASFAVGRPKPDSLMIGVLGPARWAMWCGKDGERAAVRAGEGSADFGERESLWASPPALKVYPPLETLSFQRGRVSINSALTQTLSFLVVTNSDRTYDKSTVMNQRL